MEVQKNDAVTWEFAVQFPFPYKLFMITNIGYTKFITWAGDNGDRIEIDTFGLQDYLLSTASIFKIKSLAFFMQHLKDFQFERVPKQEDTATDTAPASAKLCFKHTFFRKNCRELLKNVRRKQPIYKQQQDQQSQHIATFGGTFPIPEHPKISKHMKSDLCFAKQGTLSPLQFRRLTQRVFIKFGNESRLLSEKFRISDKRFAMVGMMAKPEDNSIPVNAEMYENPQESTLANETETLESAGFFGNANPKQLAKFFGEYLPKYERDAFGSMKIVVSLPAHLNVAKQKTAESEDVDNDFGNEPFNDDDNDMSDMEADNDNEGDNFDNSNEQNADELNEEQVDDPAYKTDDEELAEKSNKPEASYENKPKEEKPNPKDSRKGYFFHDILGLKPVAEGDAKEKAAKNMDMDVCENIFGEKVTEGTKKAANVKLPDVPLLGTIKEIPKKKTDAMPENVGFAFSFMNKD